MRSIDIIYDFLLDCGFVVRLGASGTAGNFGSSSGGLGLGGFHWIRTSDIKIYSEVGGDPWCVVFCYSEDGRVVLGASLLDSSGIDVMSPLKQDFFDYLDNPLSFECLKRYLLFWDWGFKDLSVP